MSGIEKLLRKNIIDLAPYSSARDEFSGEDATFLDANENPFYTGANRYPDPQQRKLKVRIGQIKNLLYEQIFIGNGSDEAIDLLIRAFCEPGEDNIVSIKPSYGMYKVCADISNVEFREVMLTKDYQLDKEKIIAACDEKSKILFLCSPNNPTSNSFFREDIIYLLENFQGLLVLDEAYIDFSQQESFLPVLNNFPNLVILQTMSKAWGMAGIRMGLALASREIINILSKIKYPYNVNRLTQQFALERLNNTDEKDLWVEQIIAERNKLRLKLSELPYVEEILPSNANFLMVRFKNAKQVYKYLLDKNIIVRDRSRIPLCEGCLRFTVGLKQENAALLKALQVFKNE
jgi:histidinol-phosphate aminotransferase